jgi:hypothetical protein
MKRIRVIEQGDVVFVRREGTKVEGQVKKTNVVQEGEHTGHAHRFTEGKGTIYESEGRLSVKVTGPMALLTHEEHLPVKIDKGDWEVRIVRQKDPFTKLVSKVVD